MASRESQGLQIALILFVMVAVVLGVMTFVFFQKSEKLVKELDAANAQKKNATDALGIAEFKVEYFLHILGSKVLTEAELTAVVPSIEGDPVTGPIHTAYQQDMRTYGEGLPPEKLNYRELPSYLLLAYRNKNSANTDLQANVNSLQTEKDQIAQTEKARADTANRDAETAKNELADSRKQFEDDRAQLTAKQEEQHKQYTDELQKKAVQVAAVTKQVTEREQQIKEQTVTISQQKAEIVDLRDEPFEVADGRVTWVNQEQRVVWINLGLGDGMKRQTTFSVYDREAMNLAERRPKKKRNEDEEQQRRKIDERKGKIEVTRVIDQHLAEARIVEDFAADPILPGDQIFSPAWKAGRKIRFALAGFMDLDNDGQSDRDLVRNIVLMGGGAIDCEVHDDGTLEGEVTSRTRYLVIGDAPVGTGDNKALNSWTIVRRKADDNGVQIINLIDLLNQMGYKPEIRTVGLGSNADPNQFGSQPLEGAVRSSTGNTFQERKPPPRKNAGSAY